MGLVLDTSVLIAAEKKDFDLPAFLTAEAPTDRIFITSVTASDLLHGVHRAEGRRRLKREIFVEDVLANLGAMPFDLLAARTHSWIWAELESQGHGIGPHDLMIAAICVTHDYELATLNGGEYARIDGLRLASTDPYHER